MTLLRHAFRAGVVVAVAGLLLVTLGCQNSNVGGQGSGRAYSGEGTPPATGDETGAHSGFDSDSLFAGDRITVMFYGPPNPPPPHVEQIRNDGFITPPLLGKPVVAKGKTIGELQANLQALYVPAFFQAVTITVKCDERYYFVGGDVKVPGVKPYLSKMTLLKAIQAAGDFSEFANEAAVQVTRADGRTEVYDCKDIQKSRAEDPPIYPQERIHVPRKIFSFD